MLGFIGGMYSNTDRVIYRNELIMGGVFYVYGSMGTTRWLAAKEKKVKQIVTAF